ncbi:hypothetical protein [uncultured Pseudomonas sp.]|nr:hypothetical protein [uncultured Pseudomonas sp.]
MGIDDAYQRLTLNQFTPVTNMDNTLAHAGYPDLKKPEEDNP